MAVLALKSVQEPLAGGVSAGPRLYSFDQIAKERIVYGNLTAVAVAGDVLTTIDLVRLPQGRVRLLPYKCHLWCSAWGAARTLDLGFRAYYGSDGKTVVAEAGTQLKATKDVSAALAASQIDTTSHIDFFSQGSVDDKQKGPMLFGTVRGDTIPVGATLEVILTYLQN